jgi:hypothetical protein
MLNSQAIQLKFEWDLPEEESSSALSAEEIQLRKDIAKAFIHNPEAWEKDKETGKPVKPYWLDKSVELEEGNMRFPFRAAVFTAWLCVPKKYRVPKTQDELADMLGLSSDRMFTVWQAKNPQIKAVVHASWNEKVLDHLNDSIEAMLEVAATPDYKGKGDRELHFKLAKILNDSIIVNNKGNVDLSKLSFDQKWDIAGLNDPAVQEKLREELAKRASVVDASWVTDEEDGEDVSS